MNIRNGLELITPETYGFIYITHNMVNGKKYIGQKRIDKKGKWRSYLGSGQTLKSAIKKYGTKSFYKDILDVAINENELNSKEIYWIEKYDASNSNDFYNIAYGGFGSRYKSGDCDPELLTQIYSLHSKMLQEYYEANKGNYPRATVSEDEVIAIIQRLQNNEPIRHILKDYPNYSYSSIERIRTHQCWTYLTEDIEFEDGRELTRRGNCKPIIQYDLYGHYINRYESAIDACNALGFEHPENIYFAIKQRYAKSHKCIWVLEEDDWVKDVIENTDFLSQNITLIKYAENVGLKPISKQRRKVIQYDMNGIILQKYGSIRDAANANDLNESILQKACCGKRKDYGGYIWKYDEEGGEEISA